MNNNFLTPEEIAELKAIRASKINDADIAELENFLEKNDRKLSLQPAENMNNVNDIILVYCSNKIAGQPEFDIFKKLNIKLFDMRAVIQQSLNKLSPRLYKLQLTAQTNFITIIQIIQNKANEFLGNNSFDAREFILNKDFDFSPYTIDKCDKKLIQNTIAINSAVSNFVDFICKDLNTEQRNILTRDLLNNIIFYSENPTPAVVKEKNLDFKKLVKHTHNQSK